MCAYQATRAFGHERECAGFFGGVVVRCGGGVDADLPPHVLCEGHARACAYNVWPEPGIQNVRTQHVRLSRHRDRPFDLDPAVPPTLAVNAADPRSRALVRRERAHDAAHLTQALLARDEERVAVLELRCLLQRGERGRRRARAGCRALHD